jgi:hypothetical protein
MQTFRVDPQCRIVVDYGLVIPAGFEMHKATAVERIGKIGT